MKELVELIIDALIINMDFPDEDDDEFDEHKNYL